ncbi:hypothetical protein GIB67_042637 [Kingdonia uniflora]|uniref:Uncharacterized protein n=1 Tax=Kingdonia uniflora TaxID=39325 RepID=A0A7J7M1M1_9MAGN|nr:hypothetical protein GIB67_042637 [Kingdonia uniflora]
MKNLIICSFIDPIMRGGIVERSTAKELSNVIKKQFEGFVKGRQYSNLSQLLSLKYDGSGNVRSHILKISKLVLTLKELGLTIDDTLMVYLAVWSLLQSFKIFKVHHQNQEKTWEMNVLIVGKKKFKNQGSTKKNSSQSGPGQSSRSRNGNGNLAMASCFADQWRNAIMEEMDFMSHNSVWKLAHLPQGSKPWISLTRYEYRWVDGVLIKKTIEVSAPKYMEYVMDWIESRLDDVSIFPQKLASTTVHRVNWMNFKVNPIHSNPPHNSCESIPRPETSLSSSESSSSLSSSDEELFQPQIELLHEYGKMMIEMGEAEEKSKM